MKLITLIYFHLESLRVHLFQLSTIRAAEGGCDPLKLCVINAEGDAKAKHPRKNSGQPRLP